MLGTTQYSSSRTTTARAATLVLVILGLAAIFVGWRLREMHSGAVPATNPSAATRAGVLFAESRPYCFSYTHAATTDEPYTTTEHLSLTRIRDTISGTVEGTQRGPDMTNGYTGTLHGTLTTNGFIADTTFTIEGATQTEQQIFELTDTTLTKLRYVLKEEKGKLVPDLTTMPTRILYQSIPCA